MAEFLVVTTRADDSFSPEDFDSLLPEERARARTLYAQRRFRTIWSRADGKGVVILVEADSEADVRSAMESLTFLQRGMISAVITELVAYSGFAHDGDNVLVDVTAD